MTNESGEFTPEQLAKMDSLDVVALLRRNSGDPNFYWRVREAVLNRAADEIKRLLESEAKAERIAMHWQTEAQRRAAEPNVQPWDKLLADCMAQPCRYPCLRDDLGDWMRENGLKWPDEQSENRGDKHG